MAKKTAAERQAEWRARRKAQPFLERHGIPEPPDIGRERLALEKDIQELEGKAAGLNAKLTEIVERQPHRDGKILALGELVQKRRLLIPNF